MKDQQPKTPNEVNPVGNKKVSSEFSKDTSSATESPSLMQTETMHMNNDLFET